MSAAGLRRGSGARHGSGLRDLAGMALRNLSRHRVKTLITTVAVAISVSLYIFMDGWILGMNLDSRRNIVAYEIGAAKVQRAAYFEKKDELPMYESFSGWESVAYSLARAGYDAVPRFVFSGTLYSRSGSAPLVFNAVDVEREGRVLRYPSYVETGRFPEPGKLEAALGTIAAEKLRVGIPTRPTAAELEEDLVTAAASDEEAAFIRSLYGPVSAPKKSMLTGGADPATFARDANKLALRKDAPKADLDRLWSILAAAGRMDVRISTVIDSKAEDGSGKILHVNQLIDAVVVGVINSPNPKTNGNVAFMPIDGLQDETGLMLDGKVTELLVRRAGASDADLPGKSESAAAILAAMGGAALWRRDFRRRASRRPRGPWLAGLRSRLPRGIQGRQCHHQGHDHLPLHPLLHRHRQYDADGHPREDEGDGDAQGPRHDRRPGAPFVHDRGGLHRRDRLRHRRHPRLRHQRAYGRLRRGLLRDVPGLGRGHGLPNRGLVQVGLESAGHRPHRPRRDRPLGGGGGPPEPAGAQDARDRKPALRVRGMG
jgi:hypothetical protein